MALSTQLCTGSHAGGHWNHIVLPLYRLLQLQRPVGALQGVCAEAVRTPQPFSIAVRQHNRRSLPNGSSALPTWPREVGGTGRVPLRSQQA